MWLVLDCSHSTELWRTSTALLCLTEASAVKSSVPVRALVWFKSPPWSQDSSFSAKRKDSIFVQCWSPWDSEDKMKWKFFISFFLTVFYDQYSPDETRWVLKRRSPLVQSTDWTLPRWYTPLIRMLIGPDRALVTEVNIHTVTIWKHCCREQLQRA